MTALFITLFILVGAMIALAGWALCRIAADPPSERDYEESLYWDQYHLRHQNYL